MRCSLSRAWRRRRESGLSFTYAWNGGRRWQSRPPRGDRAASAEGGRQGNRRCPSGTRGRRSFTAHLLCGPAAVDRRSRPRNGLKRTSNTRPWKARSSIPTPHRAGKDSTAPRDVHKHRRCEASAARDRRSHSIFRRAGRSITEQGGGTRRGAGFEYQDSGRSHLLVLKSEAGRVEEARRCL